MSTTDGFLIVGILFIGFLFYFVNILKDKVIALRREVRVLKKNALFLRSDLQYVAKSHAALTIEVRGIRKFPLKKLCGVLTMEDRGGKKAKVDATFYVKTE
jgi:hypothetical protein